MAGFFGLFGGKTKYVDEGNDFSGESSENGESFYLSNDEAKTLGNIEFMRKPNTIKHTFPKTASGKGKKTVKSISSLEASSVNEGGLPKVSDSEPTGSQAPAAAKTERRSSDGNLDMFRQMARDLKK